MNLEYKNLFETCCSISTQDTFQTSMISVCEEVKTLFQAQQTYLFLLNVNNTKIHLSCGSEHGVEHDYSNGIELDLERDSLSPAVYALKTGYPITLGSAPSYCGYDLEAINPIWKLNHKTRPSIALLPLTDSKKISVGIMLLFGHSRFDINELKDRKVKQLTNVLSSILVTHRRLNNMQAQLTLTDRSFGKILGKRRIDVEKKSTVGTGKIVGKSAAIVDLRKRLFQASRTQTTVFLNGETGVGKDMAAREIHELSNRSDAPFIAINCSALPSELLESELFGHVKGSFTGANQDKTGLIVKADKGVLFLDEIGDMPILLQAKLLRVLQDKKVRPIGHATEVESDFRLIAASHRNIPKMVKENTFREDLFYRINALTINIPPLRDRIEDLEMLAELFVHAFNRREKASIRIAENATEIYSKYNFPGNVRELQSMIERLCVRLYPNGEITSKYCKSQYEEEIEQNELNSNNFLEHSVNWTSMENEKNNENIMLEIIDSIRIKELKRASNEFERVIISHRLDRFNGNRQTTAASLGIAKRTLADKCKRYGL